VTSTVTLSLSTGFFSDIDDQRTKTINSTLEILINLPEDLTIFHFDIESG